MARTPLAHPAFPVVPWLLGRRRRRLGLVLALVLFAPARWLAATSPRHGRPGAAAGRARHGLERLGAAGAHRRRRQHRRRRPALAPGGPAAALHRRARALAAECCTPQPLSVRGQPRLAPAARARGRQRVAVAGQRCSPAWARPGTRCSSTATLRCHARASVRMGRRPALAVAGRAELMALRVASRLSTLRPMGSYRITLQGGAVPGLQLATLEGSLQLSGSGQWVGDRLRFAARPRPRPSAGRAGQPPEHHRPPQRRPLHHLHRLTVMTFRHTLAASSPACCWPAPAALHAQRASEPITLNFVNAEIEAVARTMAAITGRNIVVDPRVKGTITLSTERPVPPAAGLQPVRRHAAPVRLHRGRVRRPAEGGARGRRQAAGRRGVGRLAVGGNQIVTQIFRLNYENANNLVPILRPLISPNNTINVNPGNNSLVITDYADNLQRIGRIIAALDVSNATDVEVIRCRTRWRRTSRRWCSGWSTRRRRRRPAAGAGPGRHLVPHHRHRRAAQQLADRARGQPGAAEPGALLVARLDQPRDGRTQRQHLRGLPEATPRPPSWPRCCAPRWPAWHWRRRPAAARGGDRPVVPADAWSPAA
jgi:hypothetical protein